MYTAQNMAQDRSIIVNIQLLRFVAAFWVVLYHSRFFIDGRATFMVPPRFMRAVEAAGFIGVDIFFVISGMIMALTAGRMKPHWRSSLNFLGARFARIYTGWWPLFVLYWFGAVWMHQPMEDKWFFSSLFLLPVRLNHYITGVIWTLSYELYFYCAVALVIFLAPRWRKRVFAIVLAILVIFCIWSYLQGYYTPAREHESWPWQGFIGYPLVAEFLAGFLVFDWVRSARLQRKWPWFLASATFLAMAVAYEILVGKPAGLSLDGYYGAAPRALFVGGFALTLVVGALVAAPVSGVARYLALHLGDASYAIYLAHVMVMFATVKALQTLHWPAAWYGPTLLVLLLAVIAFSLAYYKYVEHPAYRALRAVVNRWCPPLRYERVG